jgi:hypothetical protein
MATSHIGDPDVIEQHGLKKLGLQTVFKISSEKIIRKKHRNNL